jgi:Tfp pilus assembly protein PilF
MSLRFGRGAPEFERRDATDLAEEARGRSLSPGEVSSYWTDRAVSFITAEPGAWLRLMLRKAALLVNASEMLDTESQESHAEWSWVLAALSWAGHFGVLVPLAVAGMILSWPRRSTLWILYALTLAYAASVVLFFVFARYRYPLVPFLILFASAAVLAPHKGVPSRREEGGPSPLEEEVPSTRHKAAPSTSTKQVPSIRLSYAAIAAAIVAALVANWPMLSSATMKAITETNVGLALQDGGAAERAIAHYRRAIELDPGYVPAYSNLGTALRAQGKPVEAMATYEHALTRLPNNADLLINLGNAKVIAGDLPGAVDAFRRATVAEPASRDARESLARATYDLGSALLAESVFVDAERALRDAIAIDDTMAEAHNNLGIALASQGKMTEAVAEFRRAIELRPGFADAERNLAMALANYKR